MADHEIHEECGVMGVWGDSEAANLIYLGLFALQHRGQEACGVVTFDDRDGPCKLFVHKAFGLVADSITRSDIERLPGKLGVGHVRYSTQGGRLLENIQPFQFKTVFGPVAIAHNGNLTNARKIRKQLEETGSVFQSTSDTEVFVHLIARSRGATIGERIVDAMKQVEGAYSLAIITPDRMFAVRDKFGFRPLVLGKRGSAHVIASETCALDLIGATYVRSIEPGELLEISATGLRQEFPLGKTARRFCSFEPIYFSRPDSVCENETVYAVRRRMGGLLAEEAPAPSADFVMAVPDSGGAMAIGYAEKAGLPLEMGLVRNHYIGRTFIEPTQAIRDFGVRLKLNPVRSILQGKRVVVVDDSLVRGTTAAKIFRILRDAGAKEIHFRIGSPPMVYSCHYGVDTPERRELLAAQKSVDEIRELLGADSLAFLSPKGLRQALGDTAGASFCYACFDGKYAENIGVDIPRQPTDAQGPGLKSKC